MECLPDILREYVSAVAESTQTPLDMAAVAALAVMSVCLQGKYKVQGKLDWIEPLNLYNIIIANPAERKSAVLKLLTEPIITYEADKNRNFAADIAHSANVRQILEKELERLKTEVAAGKSTKTYDDVRDKQKELDEHEDMTPLRLMADDISQEALTSLLAENDGKMAIISSEGGIFEILAGRYSQSINIDVFLKSHCSDPIRVDRKGRQAEYIKEPCLTVLLSIQPQVLQGIMSNEVFRGRGLCARFLYSYPKSTIGSRKFSTAPIPREYTDNYNALCRNLLDIKKAEPKILSLSGDAKILSEDFANRLEPKLKNELEYVSDWAGKLHGAVLRIAGILHVISALQADDTPWEENPPISVDTFQKAAAIGNYFTEHAKACYGFMGSDKEIQEAKFILRQLENKKPQGEQRPNDIWRLVRGMFKKTADIRPGMDILTEHGYVKLITGARDKYVLNPGYFA